MLSVPFMKMLTFLHTLHRCRKTKGVAEGQLSLCLCLTLYGGSNENGPHRLIHLNAWFPAGGTV